MNKKQIKKLVQASYTKDSLDEKKVMQIANALERSDLKEYIKALKKEEEKKKVIIAVPFTTKNINYNKLQELFPNKKLVFETDPSLITGLKITSNDVIYEMNLKSNLETVIEQIENSYE